MPSQAKVRSTTQRRRYPAKSGFLPGRGCLPRLSGMQGRIPRHRNRCRKPLLSYPLSATNALGLFRGRPRGCGTRTVASVDSANRTSALWTLATVLQSMVARFDSRSHVGLALGTQAGGDWRVHACRTCCDRVFPGRSRAAHPTLAGSRGTFGAHLVTFSHCHHSVCSSHLRALALALADLHKESRQGCIL